MKFLQDDLLRFCTFFLFLWALGFLQLWFSWWSTWSGHLLWFLWMLQHFPGKCWYSAMLWLSNGTWTSSNARAFARVSWRKRSMWTCHVMVIARVRPWAYHALLWQVCTHGRFMSSAPLVQRGLKTFESLTLSVCSFGEPTLIQTKAVPERHGLPRAEVLAYTYDVAQGLSFL